MRARKIFTEAFGRTKAASAPPESMEVTGGPSGSGWPFGPSACHTYCSLPNVTIVTGPEKNPWRPPLESSNATRTKVAPRDAAGLEGIVLEGDEGQVENPSVRLQVVGKRPIQEVRPCASGHTLMSSLTPSKTGPPSFASGT